MSVHPLESLSIQSRALPCSGMPCPASFCLLLSYKTEIGAACRSDSICMHSTLLRLREPHELKLTTLMCELQVIEFVEFKERLERSHTLAVTTSEQSLIRIRKTIPRGFAAVQAALHKASKDCHSSELPSVEQLRFNEDLSTRPAWLPPCGGPVGGALIDWWHRQRSTGCDTGVTWLHNSFSSCNFYRFLIDWWHRQHSTDNETCAACTTALLSCEFFCLVPNKQHKNGTPSGSTFCSVCK